MHHKKNRDAENAFIAEGDKVVMDLLQQKNTRCQQVLATSAWLTKNGTLLQEIYSGEVIVLKDFEPEKISALHTAPQVLAVIHKYAPQPVLTRGSITLVLDDIQDPGNLGTIIRTADWFGISNIVCSLQTADRYNPKVVQGTMGSIARVNMLYTALQEWLQQQQVPIYTTALNGTDIRSLQPVHEAILVIGNESKGVSSNILQLAKQIITIPKTGGAESLNAAVATGIALYHLTR
ncbi:MAG TPA: RNA methyltransferase [Ferruginibacter sp.]|nr:RNA methyltransferase [Ferruginibacter sp.]HMP20260.1 RNA methyltransferase [Ferruginibacter sp.]